MAARPDVTSEMSASPPTGYPRVLQNVPDGRLAGRSIFDALFFGYVAIVLGAPAACACAAYNAVALRRTGLALEAAALGALAWIAYTPIAGRLLEAGVTNIELLVLIMRVLALGVGVLLAVRHWPHVRGHRLLGGSTIPLLGAVVAAFAVAFFLPTSVYMWIIGLVAEG